ncbi:LutC/YkgG family protein [Devriesea agamarum]|uniref:LutC/YkgG family protein n=1 Tax=Devriesea agamarum TaxID=472569 RepID=UPI00071DA118|nr:LUD domain-containing protein [Devriesea agamarum]
MSNWTETRPTRTPGLSAKEEILGRIRTALAADPNRVPSTEADVPREYYRADHPQETDTNPAKIRDVLVDRLIDYKAGVRRCAPDEVAQIIAELIGDARTVLRPTGVPEQWLAEIPSERLREDSSDGHALTARELDATDVVLTGCHTAIALTGTIVLDGSELSGRRALSLVPDHHIVVVEADQIVLGVPKAIERMNATPTVPWTWISGPSATSDIELNRVEGVHGPRRLDVVIIETPAAETVAANTDEARA